MSVALGLGLGFFVLTAIAGVLGAGIVSGYQNTVDLLRQKADLMVSSEINQTRRYLEAAENQTDFIARQITLGNVSPGPDEEFTSLLIGSLSATPQIVSIRYIDRANLRLVGALRRDDDVMPEFLSAKNDPDVIAVSNRLEDSAKPFWGPVLWRDEFAQPLLNYHHPVLANGRVTGFISAYVAIQSLSESISDVETEFGLNAFILYGRDHVLAHPLLAFGYDGLTRLQPLPQQASFGDPVVASMWEEPRRTSLEQRVMRGKGVRFVSFGDVTYVVLFHELIGYADKPFLVGTYFQTEDLLSEVYRLKWGIIASLVVALLASLTAAYIGRQIAVPVRRLSDGAKRILHLDLSQVQPIPGSFFTELNEAAASFNRMLDGLRWFERYVPKRLVERLIRADAESRIGTEFRDVAVMFADLVNYAALSERLSAQEAADLLNGHFAALANCIEAEGGVVDKFIGDTLMAMWGAPESVESSCDRAVRAALMIARVVETRNEARAAAKKPVLRLRIGVHVGLAVVGNIGSPDRINYTVVGDSVNIAQRLEELGKSAGEVDAPVNILISAAVRDRLTGDYPMRPLGLCQLRGRTEKIEVFSLDTSA